MQNTLHSETMLASQTGLSAVPGNDIISCDLRWDSECATKSRTAMIVISILLAVDVAFLLSLAIYITLSYTWTSDYDAAAMMRQGAPCADELLLLIK